MNITNIIPAELELKEHIDDKAVKDILELNHKIQLFQSGKLDGESFRAFRLARGVYGQRQDGVNMIRIKLPFGRVTPEQLLRIADISDQYASSNLHATTRQDIQIHYVKLEDAPKVWADLEEKGITLREACGNTIRNLTASPYAGIDPDELFDVSPYANAMFKYFLRNPICQNLGRKFKIAFSSSDNDAALTFIHDLGFIPRIKNENGKKNRGFKILLAGGLGAQPFVAHPIFDFMEENQIIPFTEACLRIFDRYGERAKRHKARLKYLINDIGVTEFLRLVEIERKAISLQTYNINLNDFEKSEIPSQFELKEPIPCDEVKYKAWVSKNVFLQKQQDFVAVRIKLSTGNLHSLTARKLAEIAKKYASEDMRITINQGILLKYIRPNLLSSVFNELDDAGLAEPGFNSLHDITACPGTDTCNLGIASSVGLAKELERVLEGEYKDVIYDNLIRIKISGCMNGCAHHAVANIGFHGMSMKIGGYILPAMQVLLGGGSNGAGNGSMAEKVIKLPSKVIPDAVRLLLNCFENSALDGEYFNDFYIRLGKNYFYNLLKPLGEIEDISQDYLLDWGQDLQYQTNIGVGECAVPMIDMVGVVFEEVLETIGKASEAFEAEQWVESIYYSYSVYINTARALLLTKEVPCNTHSSVLKNFDTHFITNSDISFDGSYSDKVLQINKNEPLEEFAASYKADAEQFYIRATALRNEQFQQSAN
ncbi:nitrite reductase [Pedobacter sp. V48]|uniref:nitrite reductase n=1 Tax=Pedobacter sp. V48 TaxID=509635 RepID=UPI0003E4722D|nr:nitrite reductase [Pedobacter sp. V48]ETZ20992.1 hypothetical protein N824_02445 [Pedobacter sp. V48]